MFVLCLCSSSPKDISSNTSNSTSNTTSNSSSSNGTHNKDILDLLLSPHTYVTMCSNRNMNTSMHADTTTTCNNNGHVPTPGKNIPSTHTPVKTPTHSNTGKIMLTGIGNGSVTGGHSGMKRLITNTHTNTGPAATASSGSSSNNKKKRRLFDEEEEEEVEEVGVAGLTNSTHTHTNTTGGASIHNTSNSHVLYSSTMIQSSEAVSHDHSKVISPGVQEVSTEYVYVYAFVVMATYV